MCFAVETLYLIILFGSMMVQSVECSVSPHGAVDVDENEFAEFEDEPASPPVLSTGGGPAQPDAGLI